MSGVTDTLFGGGSKPKAPVDNPIYIPPEPDNPTVVAEQAEALSSQKKKKKKSLSLMTQNWDQPVLGTKGLL